MECNLEYDSGSADLRTWQPIMPALCVFASEIIISSADSSSCSALRHTHYYYLFFIHSFLQLFILFIFILNLPRPISKPIYVMILRIARTHMNAAASVECHRIVTAHLPSIFMRIVSAIYFRKTTDITILIRLPAAGLTRWADSHCRFRDAPRSKSMNGPNAKMKNSRKRIRQTKYMLEDVRAAEKYRLRT